MKLEHGSKLTEIGPIPEDWETKRLKEIALIATGNTPPTNDAANYGDEFLFVGPVDMGDSKFITTTEKMLSQKGFAKSRQFPEGAILFVCIGSTIGKCGIAVTKLTSNQQINAIFPSTNFSNEFLFYAVSFAAPRIKAQAGEQAVPLVNKTQFSETLIAVPPLREQRAIAQALSDIDALIAALDRLIAKKRDIKQATMQQLLTGKTRLPGFSSSWDVASLDMLATRTAGVWGSNLHSERNCRRAHIIRAGDISQDGRLTGTVTRYISSDEFDRAACGLDDLVITTSGNGLGKLWCCDGRENLVASNFVRVMHPIPKRAIGRFLGFALRTIEGIRQLREHTATSAYPNLRPTYFSTKWIPLPPPDEQMAIAAILSDMDAELTALESRRDKTRTLKQGMMQELLTGKTRLI